MEPWEPDKADYKIFRHSQRRSDQPELVVSTDLRFGLADRCYDDVGSTAGHGLANPPLELLLPLLDGRRGPARAANSMRVAQQDPDLSLQDGVAFRPFGAGRSRAESILNLIRCQLRQRPATIAQASDDLQTRKASPHDDAADDVVKS